MPEIRDSISYVPLRFLSYALSIDEKDIKWNGKTKTATVNDGESLLEFMVGNKKAKLNNEELIMSGEAYIQGNRTMIPISEIVKAFKHKDPHVVWDSELKKVDIYINKK